MHILSVLTCVLLFGLVSSTYASGHRTVHKVTQKQTKLDVIAVLDGSGSINSADFLKQKNAVIQLAQDLNLGSNSQRFGVVVFGTTVTTRIPLSGNFLILKSQISRIRQPKGGTNTHLGIQAMKQMFQSQRRTGVKQVGMVITDGKSGSESSTTRAASDAKRAGITMFAIGVGSGIKRSELVAIASTSANVAYLHNFSQLKTKIKSLVKTMCTGCSQTKLDVIAVLDGSGSINSADFLKQKNAVIQLAQDLNLGSNSQRFGVVVFGTTVTTRIPLSGNFLTLKSQISRIRQPKGGTNTHLGIQAMKQMFQSQRRTGVKQVGMVITDGKSKSASATKKAALEAKRAGITMFAIGVGLGSKRTELTAIASTSANVVYLRYFSQLKAKFKSLVKTMCTVLVHGGWSRWSKSLGSCRRYIGGYGYRTVTWTRTCTNPRPGPGGRKCTGYFRKYYSQKCYTKG